MAFPLSSAEPPKYVLNMNPFPAALSLSAKAFREPRSPAWIGVCVGKLLEVVAPSSDVGGIQQRVPGAVQFENKSIHAAGIFPLDRTQQREVERVCPSRN